MNPLIINRNFGYFRYSDWNDSLQSRLIAAPANLKTTGSSYVFIGSTYTGTSKKPSFVDQVAVEAWKGPAKLSPIIGFGSKVKGTAITSDTPNLIVYKFL